MTVPGTLRVDWRESPTLWGPLAWLAAVLWPGFAWTLVFFPPSSLAYALEQDWRVPALLAACIGTAAAMWLVARERRRERTAMTRLGVIARFVVYGAVFSVITPVVWAVINAGTGAWGEPGVLDKLGSASAALFMGGAMIFPSFVIGVSYAVWAGFMVALIAFRPRDRSMRPRIDFSAYPERAPEPEAPPAPKGPLPETAMEAALRPDFV